MVLRTVSITFQAQRRTFCAVRGRVGSALIERGGETPFVPQGHATQPKHATPPKHATRQERAAQQEPGSDRLERRRLGERMVKKSTTVCFRSFQS